MAEKLIFIMFGAVLLYIFAGSYIPHVFGVVAFVFLIIVTIYGEKKSKKPTL